MTKIYIEKSDDHGYSVSREDLHKYCDYEGEDEQGRPVYKLKSQYRQSGTEKAINTGLAGLGAVLRLFGL